MSQVNLLPRQIRERQRTRRQTFLVAGAGAAVMVLLFLFYMLQLLRLSDVNDRLEAQQAENAQLEAQVVELQQFQELRAQLQQRQELVNVILQNEVSWSGVLRDLSLVIPGQMWLTDFAGSVSAPAAAIEPSALVGNIQFTGNALDTPTLALWLTRLEEVRGWVNAWLSAANKSPIGGTQVINFSTSVDLTTEATVQGGSQE